MADEFDILDIVYNAIESVGLTVYKQKSVTGEKNDHVVLTIPARNEFRISKKSPLYVNIFIKNFDNGMLNEDKMKEVKREIRRRLENLERVIPKGMYFEYDVLFSQGLGEAKAGFDCCTIRLDISIQKF